ncbi:MAG: hypothetical protein K8H99_01655 [Nitrospirae bacterium]|nr:hypothetical protein [Fimbriimonadaceae bacterium]
MPVTNYHTLNGELLGETGPGGRRFYGKDALGSVVATCDQNGTLENTYRYEPYEGLLSKTGSARDPRFMWTGSTGSRTTGNGVTYCNDRSKQPFLIMKDNTCCCPCLFGYDSPIEDNIGDAINGRLRFCWGSSGAELVPCPTFPGNLR